MVEALLSYFVLFLVLFGMLHIFYFFAGQFFADYAALRGARSRAVGFADYLVKRESRVTAIGGSGLNAFTASDMTVYVVDIPAQELPKLLQLESERLREPVMRLFHTELEAVYEEFNRGMDNDGRLMYEAVNAKLFAPHPYSWVYFP